MSKFKYDKDQISVEVNGAVANVVYKDSKLYYKNLPDGITHQQAKDLAEYNGTFAKEVTEIATKEAIKVFKDNKGVEKVVAKFAMPNRGSVATVIDKERKYRAPNTGETIVKPKVAVTVRQESKATTQQWIHDLEDKVKKSL